MPVDLPLEKMTLPEKLGLLEALWNNLSSEPETFESPEWHKEVLEDRSKRVQSGEDVFSDWEAAKADIRGRIS
jgi:putative addiction module component (TIGR02574 family)